MLSLDYAGSWRNDFGSAVSSTFSWGGQLFQNTRHYLEVDGRDFAGPGPADAHPVSIWQSA